MIRVSRRGFDSRPGNFHFLLTQRKMSVTGGALYVSKLTTNNSKLACIAIWLYRIKRVNVVGVKLATIWCLDRCHCHLSRNSGHKALQTQLHWLVFSSFWHPPSLSFTTYIQNGFSSYGFLLALVLLDWWCSFCHRQQTIVAQRLTYTSYHHSFFTDIVMAWYAKNLSLGETSFKQLSWRSAWITPNTYSPNL
jgi:hypothetical protein